MHVLCFIRWNSCHVSATFFHSSYPILISPILRSYVHRFFIFALDLKYICSVDAMTYSEADVPLRAPRLLHLSANVVASHSTALLSRKTNEPTAGPSTSPIHLPLPASTAVFNALREEWVRTVSRQDNIYNSFVDRSETSDHLGLLSS